MNPIEHGASVGDHLDRTQEVAGSSPASSIENRLLLGHFRCSFRRQKQSVVNF
jgi:hypothetical protein